MRKGQALGLGSVAAEFTAKWQLQQSFRTAAAEAGAVRLYPWVDVNDMPYWRNMDGV